MKKSRSTVAGILPGRFHACWLLVCITGFWVASAAGDRLPSEKLQPSARPLTLQNCIDTALSLNRERHVSRLGMEIAEAQHRQAVSAYWPQIGARANYSIMDEDPNFIFPPNTFNVPGMTIMLPNPLTGTPIPIQTPASTMTVPQQNVKLMDRENFVATLGATLPLYTGGKITSVVRQTKAGIRAAGEEIRRSDLQIVHDTTRYYYGAVLARELVEIARDALARMQVTLELTETLYTGGSGRVKKTDWLRNRTVVEWLRSSVAALEANEQMARAALVNSMGLPWDTQIEIAEKKLSYAALQLDLKDLVGDAYRFNPDWGRLDAAIGAAAARIDEAKSGHFPKIGLFGKLTRIVNSYDSGIVTPANKNSWMVGVGLELPLFSGFQTTGEVREASARLAKLKEQQVLLREGIALQVKNHFIRLMSLQTQKEASEAAANSAEENRALHERAYRDELVETKDVIEAQLVESLVKAQFRKVVYDNLEARADLDFTIGKEIAGLACAGR